MPTGQVLRWHFRIMMQPSTISGAVEKPNSSAPSNAAIGDVTAGLHLAVGFDPDAAAQIVQHKRLMSFGQTQFPRDAAIFDRGQGRCAGAAGIAADQHFVCMGLRHTGRDRAHSHFGH